MTKVGVVIWKDDIVPLSERKKRAEWQSWKAINDYFDKVGNAVEARIGCVALLLLAREHAYNNKAKELQD